MSKNDVFFCKKNLLKKHLHNTLRRFLGKSTFSGKESILKEIFLRYCVIFFVKFWGGPCPYLVDDGFWLCRLLVQNPFEDYYVGLHLQNDLCYGYCWDCFEIYFWMMFLRCCFDLFVEWWVGRFVLRCCFEILVEWCFWMMVFMRLLWNDGESVGGVQGYVMIGRWARPTLTISIYICMYIVRG